MINQKVLIVGAGPSGLVALKEMRAVGIQAVALDGRSQIGGVFARNSNVTYEKLYLTIPNMFMAFSDYPPKETSIKYWTKEEYAEYLHSYTDHFGLRDHIRLETVVEDAKFIEATGMWQVRSVRHGVSTTDTYDFMIVATGANHTPYIPTDLLQDFEGEVIHASQYHNADHLEGKRVLVMGMGESAVDVASSVSCRAAAKTTIWSRRYPEMPPRFLTFSMNKNYDEVDFLANGQKDLLPKDFLESVNTSRIVRNLPLGVWSCCLHGLVNQAKDLHGEGTPHAFFSRICKAAWKPDYFSTDTANVPCKSGVLYHPVSNGLLNIAIAPEIACRGKTVTFQEPSFYGHTYTKDPSKPISVDVDVILAGTGYKMDFGWLSSPVSPRPRKWFKHCFPPNMGNHIAFLGYARPHQGGIPQLAEMLARYIAQLRIGNLKLPNNYDKIAIHDGETERECFHIVSHYEMFVDYYSFMMSVAGLMGCKPKMPTDVEGLVKHWTFPMWPCFFRMQGPGANLDAYHAVVDQFGPFDSLAPKQLLAVQIVFTFIMPFLNLFSYMFHSLFDFGKRTSIPRLYRWRMSKSLFLYNGMVNDFSVGDAALQIVAGLALLLHVIRVALTSLFHTNKTSVEQ